MKLTAVELHPHGSSTSVMLSFRDPGRVNPYSIKSITGLDAEEIVARYYGGLGSSAQKFYTMSLEKRTVGVLVSLNPRFELNESASELRDDIYRLVASSRTGLVHLHLLNGEDVVAAVNGFISKVEAPLFEKTQEVKVTIEGVDMFLRAPTPVDIDVSELDPADTVITDLQSTAPHGFSFELEFVEAKASVNIHDPNDDTWAFEITPTGGFLADDVLHFSSEHNDKHIYIQRGVDQIHVADKITPGSIWPILFHGENTLMVDGVTETLGVRNMNWLSISHRPTYWGV